MASQLRGLGFKDIVTLLNLASGFLSILFVSYYAMPLVAAIFVLVGALLDGLDGLIARAEQKVDHFGTELDSLADLVTFGVAPALMAVLLSGTDALVVAAAVLYAACAAVRLARFNLQEDKHFFVGLPSPAAGIVVAFSSLFFGGLLLFAIVLIAAIAMVAGFKVKKFSIYVEKKPAKKK